MILSMQSSYDIVTSNRQELAGGIVKEEPANEAPTGE